MTRRTSETNRETGRQPDIPSIRNALIRYCLALTRSQWDAEDLVQETCLKTLRVLQGIEPHANPEAYVLRAAKNAWIDRRRRARYAGPFPPEDQAMPFPETTALDVEAALKIVLSRLSPLQRVVWMLRDLFGYSNADAAGLLGRTEGAVKAALHRARAVLKTLRKPDAPREAWADEAGEVDKDLLKAYVSAFLAGDAEALVRLVREDAVEPASAIGTVLARTMDRRAGDMPQALFHAA